MKLLLLLMTIFLCACSFHRTYVEYADMEISSLKKEVKKKYGLSVVGEGGGFMSGIENIYLLFGTTKKCGVEDLRYMIVSIYLEFLEKLNKNEQLKPYVEGNFFTHKHLDFSIMCTKPSGGYRYKNGLSGVMYVNGKFLYLTFNPETEHLDNYYVETYEEAVSIYMRNVAERVLLL